MGSQTCKPRVREGAGIEDASANGLRVWETLASVTATIERGVQRRLRERYGTSLPRFQLLAQLARAGDGLRMRELASLLRVTPGAVTGLVDPLVDDGMVEPYAEPGDRRACPVRLTPHGRDTFREMAREHERWIDELAGGLGAADTARLVAMLTTLHANARERSPQATSGSVVRPFAKPGVDRTRSDG